MDYQNHIHGGPKSLVLLLATTLLLLNCDGGSKPADLASSSTPNHFPAEVPQEVVEGMLLYAQNCLLCHTPIATFNQPTPTGSKIFEQTQTNPMMSGLKDKISREQADKIAAAIKYAKELPASAPTSSVIPNLVNLCADKPFALDGKTTYRRMNSREFTNSVRDLFGMSEINVTNFPMDYYSTQGFDSIDGVVSTSPLETDRIVTSIEKVVEQVVEHNTINTCLSTTTNANSAFELIQAESFSVNSGAQVESSPDGAVLLGYLEDGDYLQYNQVDFGTGARSAHLDVANESAYAGKRMELRIDSLTGPILGSLTVQSTNGWYNFVRQPVSINMVEGVHDLYIIMRDGDSVGNIDSFVFSVADASVAPTGGIATPAPTSYRACVESLLVKIARRAYRRPVAAADVAPLVELAMDATTTPEEAFGDAITAILISPRFLFHVVDYTKNVVGTTHTMSDHEMAAKMSFFLWQSIPDEELLDLADAQQLSNTNELKAQVSRMLADAKARRLEEAFPGQWLNYRNVATAVRPVETNPEFTPAFKESIVTEANMLFADILQSSSPIDKLVTADYAFVDTLLADFYGLANSNQGQNFVKTNLDTSYRRGILTQSAIMTATSISNASQPIRRGIFVLDRILCQELSPPPEGIPMLERVDPTLPMRDRLALHRTNATCAACHKSIDPPGLAYENFTSTGKFRTTQGTYTIDASGTTEDGTTFHNASDLALWMADGEKLEACFSKHISSFALGRALSDEDTCNAYQVMTKEQANASSSSMKQMIESLILSDLFRKSKMN